MPSPAAIMDSRNVKMKSKPSHYSPRQFHGVRAVSALSSLIVTGILVFFCIELASGKFKIPWTFLIVLAASVITLIVLLFTTFIHCCGRLSPLFNLVLNVPLLLLWIVGMGLLAWNIYGTLTHSCSIDNWGNDDGIMICSQYKALFSFVVFGTLSQIAMIMVDVRARMVQTRSGRYAKMRDSQEVKLEPYDSTHSHSHSHASSIHDAPYVGSGTQYRDEPGWRPGQRTNTVASSHYSTNDYGDIAGRDGRTAVRMNDFNPGAYHAPAQQTGYDSGYSNQAYGDRF